MKKVLLALLVVILSVAVVGESFAQEEYEGFFKRMMKRFKKDEAAVSTEEEEEEVVSEKAGPKKVPQRPVMVVPEPPRPAPIEPIPAQPVEVKREMPKLEKIEIDVPKKEVMVPREEKAGQAGEDVELTKEDMIKEITESVDYYENILITIPSLKRNIDEDGNVYYTREVEGVQERLEDMSLADLESLYSRVMGEASRLNAERILQQLEQIRQTQRLIQGPPSAPKPPDIPRALPRTPTAPSPPPAPPRTPAQPPAQPPAPSAPPRR